MMIATLCAILRSLGKWRYLLTGVPIAAAFGLLCRNIGKLAEPAAQWYCFTGECTAATPTSEGTQLRVCFSDRHRLSHDVMFCTPHPHAAALQAGDTVSIAIRREIFIAGSYPANTPEPQAARSVYLRVEQKRFVRRALLRILVLGVCECGISISIALLAMHFCFP